MRVKLTQPVDLTGVITAPGVVLDVTPEFGKELIRSGKAEELGIIRKIQEKIEKAVEPKHENRTKSKDN